jgi:hypothetical protein
MAGQARTVAIAGSTGSIGAQTIDVVRADPGRYRVVALGAARSVERLAAQARELRPERVAVADASLEAELKASVPAGTEVWAGEGALAAIAVQADVVVNGVVGFAGLPVTLAALEAGRRLALANKESLIAAGPVVQRARRTPGAEIVPGRLRALRRPPVPAGWRARPGATRGAHGQRRPVPGPVGPRPGLGDDRGRPGPSDLVDGAEDHGGLVHADEQGT